MPNTHALLESLPYRVVVRIDAVLEKGERIPDDEIDSWITMPAGDEGGGRRFPIKYDHIGPGKVVARVHPKFHPELPGKWRDGKPVPPTEAETQAHAESLEKLKAREIVIDGDALQKHKEILASIAGQGDVHSAASQRAQDALEKLEATDVATEKKKRTRRTPEERAEADRKKHGSIRTVGERVKEWLDETGRTPEQALETWGAEADDEFGEDAFVAEGELRKLLPVEKRSMQDALQYVNAQLEPGERTHASVRNKMGWSSADASVGKHLAETPEEDWTPADRAKAYELTRKYQGQHGIPMEAFDKPAWEGGRLAKSLSLRDGKVVYDYPYNPDMNEELKGLGRARWNPGAKKIEGSLADLVRNLGDEDPIGTLEHWAERNGFHVDPELRGEIEEATKATRERSEKVKARAGEIARENIDKVLRSGDSRAIEDEGKLWDPVERAIRASALEQARKEIDRGAEEVAAKASGKSVIRTPWDWEPLGFGKNRDKTWREMATGDRGYLEWLAGTDGARADIARHVLAAADGRETDKVRAWREAQESPEGEKPTGSTILKTSTTTMRTPYDDQKVGGNGKNAERTWGEMWQNDPSTVRWFAENADNRHGAQTIARELIDAKRNGVESPRIQNWRERLEKQEAEDRGTKAQHERWDAAKRDTSFAMPPEFDGGLFDPKMGKTDPTTYDRDPETGEVIPGTAKPAAVRPYQAQGVNFMAEAPRCFNFDTMGLGKSIQTVSAALLLKQRGEVDGSMVIYPPSLTKNWQDEIRKFAPGARVLTWAGTSSARREVYEKAKRDGFDFLLVPSSMTIQKEDGPMLGELGGVRIAKFVDEAHELKGGTKNVGAKMTWDEAQFLRDAPKSVGFREEAVVPGLTEALRSKMYKKDIRHRAFVLTDKWSKFQTRIAEDGDDAVDELTSGQVKGKKVGAIKQWLSAGHFKMLTATPVPNDPKEMFRLMQLIDPKVLGDQKKYEDRYLVKTSVSGKDRVVGFKNLQELHGRLKPYFIMRKLDDPEVAIQLPDRIDVTPELDVPAEHRPYLEAATKDALAALTGADAEIDPDAEPESTSDPKQKSILTTLLRLRQIAVSPELVDRNYDGPAPKIDACVQVIRDHLKMNPGKGIAVFSEFRDAFPILQRKLMEPEDEDSAGLTDEHFGMIAGGVSKTARNKAQDDFNAGRLPVLFLQTQAGGSGLNLQSGSSAVVHVTSPWNPAIEDQATARVYRPGQLNKVVVFKPQMAGSIDAKIQALHEKKRQMADAILGKGDKRPKTLKLRGNITADFLRKALSEGTK